MTDGTGHAGRGAAGGRGFGLVFEDAELERQFWHRFQRQHRSRNQFAVVLGLLLFCLFAVVDRGVGDDHWQAMLVVRLGFTLPLLLIGVAGFFIRPIVERYTGPLVFFVLFVSGASVVVMNTMLPPEVRNLYFTGLLIVLVFGHGFFRTDFRWPAAAIALTFVVYLYAALWVDPVPAPMLLASTFYYVSAAVIMVITGWSLEQQERNNFLMERQLRYLAHTDELTGLANRRAFIDHFSAERQRALRDGRPLSLFLVDLDHLKQINDSRGHEHGDATLKALAGALRALARRPGDLAARLGGDEFVLLLSDCSHDQGCRIARDLASGAAAQADVPFTASIGMITMVPDSDCTLEQLLQQADDALYQAKRGGRAQAVCRRRP
ncbi:MAG TPA: diguanylate cyclase [Sedimenticola thiotaurini]|uniref:diguanylate cyclase n=1 Tax=Sedimenticola thiotaurini TaxID=1543721 RepID=A0A831W4K5_9GAMM|nr:diguanylate cyclase [Sedimenticola thiotaurini]